MHRILFSIASLTLTVCGRRRCRSRCVMGCGTPGIATLVRARRGRRAALLLRQHRAGRRRRSRCRRVSRWSRVWQRNFLWSAPSYLAGARAGRGRDRRPSARGWFGWLALLAVPLYLVFRSYHTVVARLREEQDETRRAMDVQLATIEALALAIEAKAGCTPGAHPIDSAVRGDAGRSGRPVRRATCRRCAPRRCCTTSATWRCPSTSCRSPMRSRPKSSSASRFTRASAPTSCATCRSARRSASWCSAITSAGTAWATRPGCAARTFRSARASWRLPTATARCRPIARTARRAARPRRSRCCASTPARRSIRRWSTC